ncbi:retinol dehydrogenase 12 isoform X3 [Dermacentor silvarum]|uniref:retinol dehydrogenase 12 isoform X3 n=1 Tax=Dermacentor silvarum TaxID=543639 RepID=UPI002101AF96|nr:retinol dehydrogenase 12 isoform X3 [Dermacentor silvarum]
MGATIEDAPEALPTPGHRKVLGLVWRTVREALFLLEVGTLCVLALFVRKGVCRSKASMEGKTVIVTGANAESKAVKLTEDGYELCYQSNYLSHYLLTMRLLGLLRRSAPSRVVNVSSAMHHLGTLSNPDKLARGLTPVRHPTASYACSKLAQVAFTRSLAHKLRHTGVTVNALHPGDVKTNIATNSPGGLFFGFLLALGGKTAEEGAQTSIYLAVEPKMTKETGRYYSDCQRAWISRQAADRRRCERFFWDSARLVRLDEAEVKALVEK